MNIDIEEIKSLLALSSLTSSYYISEYRFGVWNGFVAPLDIFIPIIMRVSQQHPIQVIEDHYKITIGLMDRNKLWEEVLIGKNSTMNEEMIELVSEILKFFTPIFQSKNCKSEMLKFYQDFNSQYRMALSK